MSQPLFPEESDTLFQSGNNDYNAIIDGISPTFTAYAFSYKLAADSISNKYMDAPDSFYRSFQVFPLIFLYRQHIELSLKAIIYQSDQIKCTERTKDNLHHDLLKLWSVAKDVIIEMSVNVKKDTLSAVEKLIKEFNENDPRSFSFRYPVNKNGDIVSNELHQISIKNLHNTMSKLSNFFNEALGHLYHIG